MKHKITITLPSALLKRAKFDNFDDALLYAEAVEEAIKKGKIK